MNKLLDYEREWSRGWLADLVQTITDPSAEVAIRGGAGPDAADEVSEGRQGAGRTIYEQFCIKIKLNRDQ